MTSGPAPITGKDWQDLVEPRIMAEDLRALEQGIKQAIDSGGVDVGQAVEDYLVANPPAGTGGSVPDGMVPIFRTLAEAQAWETANPGSVALHLDIAAAETTAAAPTFTDASGTAGDEYTIPAVTGVIYKVDGVTTAAGTYPGIGTVTVTAEAEPGWTLTAGTTTWSHTFSTATDPIEVTATAPTWTDDTINGGGTWTTPTIAGVTYSPASGTATAGESVTVTATADSGYTLTGTTSWTHTFPVEPVAGTITLADTFDRADGNLVGTSVDTGSAVWAVDAANDMLTGNSPASPLIDAGAATNPISTDCAALIRFTPPAEFEASIDMVANGSKNARAALFGYMVNVKSSTIQGYAPATSLIGSIENTAG